MTPIPPPGKGAREPKRADRTMMVAIVCVALIGIIIGWIIRDATAQEAPTEPALTAEFVELVIVPPTTRPDRPEMAEPEQPEPEAEAYYPLTETEREEIEQVVMSEAGGESYDGQVAVAQCICNTAIRDSIGPLEVIIEYKYTPVGKEPTQSVREAVRAVFDRGEAITDEPIFYFYAPALVKSAWHESQEFVTELGGHRFFR